MSSYERGREDVSCGIKCKRYLVICKRNSIICTVLRTEKDRICKKEPTKVKLRLKKNVNDKGVNLLKRPQPNKVSRKRDYIL